MVKNVCLYVNRGLRCPNVLGVSGCTMDSIDRRSANLAVHFAKTYNYIAPAIGIKSHQDPSTHALSESSLHQPYPVLFPFKCLRRKQRCEKNPIPPSQKDEKYFEKRKRNNEAAKKSRDARKIREDRIALKAALLEQENAILKSYIFSLQEEIHALTQIVCLKSGPPTSTQ